MSILGEKKKEDKKSCTCPSYRDIECPEHGG